MGARSVMGAKSRRRKRSLVVAFVGAAMALATVALAQPRSKGSSKPAKPVPSVKVDAQAPPVADEGNAVVDSATPSSVPEPPPQAIEAPDGGRLSPLNPDPEELPSSAIDAGVPVDYDRLLADIAALRARVAAVSDSLYRSRIAVSLQTEGKGAAIGRLTVSLDDGVVYTAPPSFSAADMTSVYEHAVAPGRHAVTLDVERKDTRDQAFRTSQRSRFTIDVPRDHKVVVEVKITDDSSMGADFPSGGHGKYDLRFRVKAVAKPVGK